MTGLLDNRSRLIDTIVTQEGKRQLFSGKFRIAFASFSDAVAHYESDVDSGSSDAGERAYFEATSLPHDAIAFETDDSGVLVPKEGLFRDDTGLIGDKLVVSISGSNAFLSVLTGSAFASSGSKLLKSSLGNFSRHRVIGSRGPFDDEIGFVLNQNSASFDLTDDSPIPFDTGIANVAVNEAGDIFSDPKLSHLPNFKFLPPKNASVSPGIPGDVLGAFQPLGPRNELKPEKVVEQISTAEELGNAFDVKFTKTSKVNNVFAQFFEINETDLKKLDVIDYGSFVTDDSPTNKHVFFVGKVFTNSFGVHTFVNMFTLMFFDKDIVSNVL